jgi:hypothetical protein
MTTEDIRYLSLFIMQRNTGLPQPGDRSVSPWKDSAGARKVFDSGLGHPYRRPRSSAALGRAFGFAAGFGPRRLGIHSRVTTAKKPAALQGAAPE